MAYNWEEISVREVVLLEKIRIQNVRSLKDTGDVPLSPITLLVGENSSGKSTFLRTFPLLRQSISKRTDGPILWAGDVDDYVDFGSFDETVTNDGSTDMTFSFSFEATTSRKYIMRSPNGRMARQEFPFPMDIGALPDHITYSITISRAGMREHVSKLHVTYNNATFTFNLSPQHKRPNVIVDGSYDYPLSQKEDARAPIYFPVSRIFEYDLPNITRTFNELFSLLGGDDKARAEYQQEDDEDDFALDYDYRRVVTICQMIGVCLLTGLSWDEIQAHAIFKGKEDKDPFLTIIIRKLGNFSSGKRSDALASCKLAGFRAVLPYIEDYLSAYFRQVHYIAPLRATAERYYRLRNLSIDEVDYQGKNLAMFLNGLTRSKLQSFQSWTRKYFGFEIDVKRDGGHISVQVALTNGNGFINISDTGFGYSQILPIITQLWVLSTSIRRPVGEATPLVIAIEQPELHLHPALQAKLANAFRASIELAKKNHCNLQLLIETHSETIVNFFGRAIARKIMSPKDVSVVLFEKKREQNQTEVRISQYDEAGYLQNWPLGFFVPEE